MSFSAVFFAQSAFVASSKGKIDHNRLDCIVALFLTDALGQSFILDPLFGYDFFVAVNNPTVREMELLPYADYYMQTTELMKKWEKYRKKHGLPIPLS